MRRACGWPLIDSGAPCDWPGFALRSRLARRGRWWYRFMWGDFR